MMEALDVSLRIRGGFAIGSGFGLSGVLDDTIMRDSGGLPYIPGTSLKGIIREACEELEFLKTGCRPFSKVVDEISDLKEKRADIHDPDNYSKITRIFGSPFIPSNFIFHSAYLRPREWEFELIKDTAVWNESHNSIHPETGTAKTDHLFTLEVAAGEIEETPGYKFDFRIVPGKPDVNDELTSLLICGILFADRLGAGKTRGKGRIEMDIAFPYQEKTKQEWVNITFPEQPQ